ncbi:MAG TPA: peptidoglycan DD-metalloendopeptidase family protein [Longimicrobiales bacterium]|nr:peptidoglycan DD-metalloendopeptidase family protein [Longimicrobiales bacterium]
MTRGPRYVPPATTVSQVAVSRAVSRMAIPFMAIPFMAILLLAVPVGGAAQESVQEQIRASQERLERIRSEREQLQAEMENLQGRARSITQDLANIEQQVNASAAALRELDFQTAALTSSVDATRQQLVRTRDRLRERNVVLNQRLRAIYRQGPLHTVRVLLSAASFGDLLNRYKYLHLVSVHDRLLLEEITELERALVEQEEGLRGSLSEIERVRAEKLAEFAQLQALEQSRTRTLREVRSRVSQTEGRIQQLAEDERRLTGVLDDLERQRLEAERRRAAAGRSAGPATMSADDLGRLPWPLDGPLLYQFGPERRPNGVTLRRNGIGITAEPGARVRAVNDGTVAVAGPMEGFNQGVVLSHGEGYYTLYLYLGEVNVVEGQDVSTGTVIGSVGPSSEDGPHLFFRIHAPVNGQAPVAVDPLPWLRDRQ